MFTVRHHLFITTPEGKTKKFNAYCYYVGPNRLTWISMDGIRHYVLFRHGFTYYAKNA